MMGLTTQKSREEVRGKSRILVKRLVEKLVRKRKAASDVVHSAPYTARPTQRALNCLHGLIRERRPESVVL